MEANIIRQKHIDFFVKKGHKQIPSAPLVPENDPTTLFTSSGMQPLIPYLLGEPHPLGKRLVNCQKSFRAADIDEVGDNRHTTFFEMLGNWSLGDYFKKEQLPWIFEFLTSELGLDPQRLYISVFSGDKQVPKDNESIKIWQDIFSSIGIVALEGERIFAYSADKNWWSRAGEPDNMPEGEPGGPDSEVFYDFGAELKLHENSSFKSKLCHPNCQCGRFAEIANSVFMQFQKQKDGTLKELDQKNVDFGGGLERMLAATESSPDMFKTDLFLPIIATIEKVSDKKYGQDQSITRAIQIVTDHIKAAVMMMADGVLPANKLQGYVLRRLIRRSLLYTRKLGLSNNLEYLDNLVEAVAEVYQEPYPEVSQKTDEITLILKEEAMRFSKSLEHGLKEFEKYSVDQLNELNAFNLYQSFGFPFELTGELFQQQGKHLDKKKFDQIFADHKKLSQKAAHQMFKGGLADHSQEVIKLHTATHLLHQVLRNVLGSHVQQKGSNITADRLRFDFSHPNKLTSEEIYAVEKQVNEIIQKDLPVSFKIVPYQQAINEGALAFFAEKYPEKVKVYTIGPSMDSTGSPQASSGSPFSREICGGPHVERTGILGKFKIIKEESLGTGIRRIYGVLN